MEHEVTTASDIERALGAADRSKVDGVFILSPTIWTNFPSLVLRLTKERRLPLVSHRKEWVQQGALFSYAPDLAAIGRLAAPYVTKILNGTKPGALPVQEPTKFELVVNLKTAKWTGLTEPRVVLGALECLEAVVGGIGVGAFVWLVRSDGSKRDRADHD